MALTITAEQRDALYDQILDRLGGIDDVRIVVQNDDFEAAERLGREYSDDLRLVLDDLGFGEGTGEQVELTSPPDVLARVLTRMREHASTHAESVEAEQGEAREMETRNRLVVEACGNVLADLDGTHAGGR
jgi:hypothetical protein